MAACPVCCSAAWRSVSSAPRLARSSPCRRRARARQRARGAARAGWQLGRRCALGTGIGLDVAHEGSVRALVDRVEKEQGTIDLFFSNAGYGSVGGLEVPNEE